MSAKYPSPPSSPRISTSRLSLYTITQTFTWMQRIRKAKLIVSSSGPEPITHPALSGAIVLQKAPVHHVDEFTCKSAVDVPRLLRVCRSDLLKLAELVNANTLVDEQYIVTRYSPILAYDNFYRWEVIIDPPNNPASGSYKVQVRSCKQQ